MRKDYVSAQNVLLKIRALQANGYNGREIADMTGVTHKTIYTVLNGTSKYVKLPTYQAIDAVYNRIKTEKEAEQTASSYFIEEDGIDLIQIVLKISAVLGIIALLLIIF